MPKAKAQLDPARQALLEETRQLTGELAARAEDLGVPEPTRKALADALDQLARPFLLVVVGEFNAGKSAFINALLGVRVLEEGVTPTTSRVGILRHGVEIARSTRADGISETTAPAEVLRALPIVDTPGTNAVLREHEALTRDFLPRADLVLFVTSADRPYTESERAFLEAIRQWGKKIVVVLNKADLLKTQENEAKVVAFVREHAGRTLGALPEVLAVSSLRALEARERDDTPALEASGLPAFEARVMATLDEAERFRLKLQSPLGVARRALGEATALVARAARRAPGATSRPSTAIEARVAGRSAELARDFGFRLSDVEKVLLEFERRGNAFFDERLRLGRFRELFDRDRLRRDFEAEAVAGLPYEVELRVDGVVDFLVEAELRQWQDVMALVAERKAARADSAGGASRPLRLRPLAPARERPRGGPGGGRALRRARRGAAAGREGARVGGAGRAAAGLGARPRHDRGRAREHHRRRRDGNPRRRSALADRPVPAPRAAGEGAPGAQGQGRVPCARS